MTRDARRNSEAQQSTLRSRLDETLLRASLDSVSTSTAHSATFRICLVTRYRQVAAFDLDSKSLLLSGQCC